jgi:predicted PurR-regulated permease PerM
MKRLALNAAVVMATLAGLFLLWEFREVFWIFLFSLALGAATRPAVESIAPQRIPRGLRLVAVYLGLIALVVLLTALVSNPFIKELSVLSDRMAQAYETIYTRWPAGGQFQKAMAAQLPPPKDLYLALTGESGTRLAQTLLGVTLNSFTFLSQVFIVIVLSIYWSIDRIHFERLWLSLLPVDRRAWARDVWRETESGIGKYLRNETARLLLAGLALSYGLRLLGVPYPTLLGVAGAFLSLVPWLGLFMVILPVLLAGLSVSPLLGIGAAVYALAVLLLLEVVIQPRIFGRLYYSPFLMVLLALALAEAFGLIAILLAPPLAATLQMVFRSIQQPSPQDLDASSTQKLADIRTRLEDVHHLASESGGDLEARTGSMLARLDDLVQKTGSFMRTEGQNARRSQFLAAFMRNRGNR